MAYPLLFEIDAFSLYKEKIKQLVEELKAKPLFAYFYNNRIYIYIVKEIEDADQFNLLFDVQNYLDVYNRIFNTNQTIEILPSKNPLLKIDDIIYMNEILNSAELNYDLEMIKNNTIDFIANKEIQSIDEFLKEIDNFLEELEYRNELFLNKLANALML